MQYGEMQIYQQVVVTTKWKRHNFQLGEGQLAEHICEVISTTSYGAYSADEDNTTVVFNIL